MSIMVIPGKFPRGGFVAAVVVDGCVVADAWGRTKAEAKTNAKRAARELGVRA